MAAAAVVFVAAGIGLVVGGARGRREVVERERSERLQAALRRACALSIGNWEFGVDRAFALLVRRRHAEQVEAALRALPRPARVDHDAPLAADLDQWSLLRLELHDADGARALFDEASDLDPDPARVAMRAAILTGDTPALLERARAPGIDASPAPTIVLLARGLAACANEESAARLLERAIERDFAEFQLRLALGEILARGGPPASERARLHLETARALRPGSIRVAVRLAEVIADSFGAPSDAVAVASAVARRDLSEEEQVDEPVLAWALGVALFRARHHEEARTALNRALELDASFALAHATLGEIALDQQRLDRAERAFRRSLELAETVDARDGLGSVLWLSGRQDEALELLERSVRRHPDDALLRDHLATLLVQRGRFAEGLAQLREAAHLDPWIAEVQNDYAWELVNSGDPSLRRPGVALEHTQRACELEPWNAWYRNTLAVTYYRLGDYERCVAEIEEIRDMPRGGGPYDLFFLAMAKQKLGLRADAVELFDRAVALMPDDNDELVRLKAEAEQALGTGDGR